jgi:exodeoxyribonuclease-5
MIFSRAQVEAIDTVGRWLKTTDRQVFRLFGCAGSGKSTIARYLAEQNSGATLFAAYTGKAALVMRNKGCPTATTIHSLIYRYCPKSKVRLRELQLAYGETPDDPKLLREIEEEQEKLRRPAFELNQDSDLRSASLLVVDECSMVGGKVGKDLESFGVPILVLGDPFQLPPVADAGHFTNMEPDILLTDIHRQAADSPVIKLATQVRLGHRLKAGTYGDSAVLSVRQFDYGSIREDQQIIVGLNKSRQKANTLLRGKFNPSDKLFEVGDKLICLKNNHEMGLLNGSMWRVEAAENGPHTSKLDISSEDDATIFRDVDVFNSPTDGGKVGFPIEDVYEFDRGYAITCHKAQGSQYESIIVKDESSAFRQYSRQWLYTAITRASLQATVLF